MRWRMKSGDYIRFGELRSYGTGGSWSRRRVPVPGIAYMDGRDFEAKPPLTVMRINLWETMARRRVTGCLRHGQRVRVLDRVWMPSEKRYYYLVRHWFKSGWVSELFLSLVPPEPDPQPLGWIVGG